MHRHALYLCLQLILVSEEVLVQDLIDDLHLAGRLVRGTNEVAVEHHRTGLASLAVDQLCARDETVSDGLVLAND